MVSSSKAILPVMLVLCAAAIVSSTTTTAHALSTTNNNNKGSSDPLRRPRRHHNAAPPTPPLRFPTQQDAPIMGILVEPPAWNTCVTFGDEGSGEAPATWKEEVFHHHGAASDSTTTTTSPPSTTNPPEPTLPPSGTFSGCVWSLYVKWLQAAGIRVVPVPWKTQTPNDVAYLNWYLERINGVLLPGGQLGSDTEVFAQYFQTIQHIFKYTVDRNRQGDPFVFWGTCQGFEMINAAAAGTPEILLDIYSGMKPLSMSVNFTEFGKTKSTMFGVEGGDAPWGGTPQSVIDYMEKYPTTVNWHKRGIAPCQYSGSANPNIAPCSNSSWNIPNSTLGDFMIPLATTLDPTGKEFVAAAQAIDDLKIFTVQFHPEKPIADFRRDAIFHDHRSVAVAQYLALFLRDQLVLNNHTFDNAEQANGITIENYHYSQMGWGVQVYFI